MTPQLLVIGQVAKDLTSDGYEIGGPVVYGALTAARLGVAPAVVTSAGPELDSARNLPGIPVHNVESPVTTTFRNTYGPGVRSQAIEDVAGCIDVGDVPPAWRSAPLVMLACLAGEIAPGLASCFPRATVLASLQGWLREWDAKGNVSPRKWDGDGVLPHVNVAVLSRDDLGDPVVLERWKTLVPVLIVTQGPHGADISVQGTWHHVPAYSAHEVDPTGAGDVFAAAYLVRHRETGDPVESARFAACAASFCVEARGTTGIPDRARVEARLANP